MGRIVRIMMSVSSKLALPDTSIGIKAVSFIVIKFTSASGFEDVTDVYNGLLGLASWLGI